MSNLLVKKFGSVLGLTNEDTAQGYLAPTAVNRPHLSIAVFSPRCFDDVKAMSDILKSNRAVLVHLDQVDSALSCRVIDYMNGVGYALNANAEKVSEKVILYAPAHASIEKAQVASRSSRWF